MWTPSGTKNRILMGRPIRYRYRCRARPLGARKGDRGTLALSRQAKLARLGHVALDGTEVAANASKHKTMSYARPQQAEQRPAAEVQA